jgi:hypothetical protein
MIIVIAGMPRSGSTLQANIAKALVEGHRLGRREDWSIDWQKDLIQIEQYVQDDEFHIYKSHWVNDNVIQLMKKHCDKCYILSSHRDIRDVAASMMLKFDYTFSKAKSRIGRAITNIDRIRNCGVPYLEQDYSTLRYSLVKAVSKVADFLAIELSPAELNEITNRLDVRIAFEKSREKTIRFEGLRRKIAFLFRTKFPYADNDLMLHSKHVSNHMGRSGIWRDRLTEDQVAELERLFPGWCESNFPR